MRKWAIIEGGVVINSIFWDGESYWSADSALGNIVEISTSEDGNSHPGIGWTYKNGIFSPIPEPVDEDQSL